MCRIIALTRDIEERGQAVKSAEREMRRRASQVAAQLVTAITRTKSREGLLQEQGVYIVQLLTRENTLKIGKAECFSQRFYGLKSEYGPIAGILALPYPDPPTLERAIHTKFVSMRLWNASGTSELFCFATRPQQRFLEEFLQDFPACRLGDIQWQTAQNLAQTEEEPLSLFAF
jgi:hypothetical protein